jgi:hypothetical protein
MGLCSGSLREARSFQRAAAGSTPWEAAASHGWEFSVFLVSLGNLLTLDYGCTSTVIKKLF